MRTHASLLLLASIAACSAPAPRESKPESPPPATGDDKTLFAELHDVLAKQDITRLDAFGAPVGVSCTKPGLTADEVARRFDTYREELRQRLFECGARFDWARATLVGVSFSEADARKDACDGRLTTFGKARAYFADARDRYDVVIEPVRFDGKMALADIRCEPRMPTVSLGAEPPPRPAACTALLEAAKRCDALDPLSAALVSARATHAVSASADLSNEQRVAACEALPTDPCVAWATKPDTGATSPANSAATLVAALAERLAGHDLAAVDAMMAPADQLACAKMPFERERFLTKLGECATTLDWSHAAIVRVGTGKDRTATPSKCKGRVVNDVLVLLADPNRVVEVDLDALVIDGRGQIAGPVRCTEVGALDVAYDLPQSCVDHVADLAKGRESSFDAYARWLAADLGINALRSDLPAANAPLCDELRR